MTETHPAREGEYLTNVSDVEYPNGDRGPCYALVGIHGTGCAVSILRAMELQREGVPFAQPHPVYPGDFATWFGPDFPQIDADKRLWKVLAERRFGETVDHRVETFGPDWTRSIQTVEGVRIQLDLRPTRGMTRPPARPGLTIVDDAQNQLSDGTAHALVSLRAQGLDLVSQRLTVRICDQVKRGPNDVADLVSRAARAHVAGIPSARSNREV